MRKFFVKPFRWAVSFSLILTAAFSYLMLDTFIIPKSIQVLSTNTTTVKTNYESSSAVISENSYQDDNIQITIQEITYCDSTVYIADIQVSDVSFLKAAFAENTYGYNVEETTSEIAEENNGILAINGDFYGFRKYGYVVRNGCPLQRHFRRLRSSGY
jgi:hypothetical protein